MASSSVSQPSEDQDDEDVAYANLDISVGTEISVLRMGSKFTYRIPSFPVLTVDIRHIVYQVVTVEGHMLLFDGFIRADSSLEPVKEIPFTIQIQDGCCVTVEEFSKEADVTTLHPIAGHGFLIVWQWVDIEEKDEDRDSVVDASYVATKGETLSTGSDTDGEEDISDRLSTVVLKCIGVTRDASYQESLLSAHRLLNEGKTVPVKLVPEPTNPYDSRAICIQCEIDGKWKIVGYVVKEICDSIHQALDSNSVTSTKFAWIKYKIVRKTGPGYYAGVEVTRKGEWPPAVMRSASTMF